MRGKQERNAFAAWLERHKLTADTAAPIIGLHRASVYRIKAGKLAISPMLAVIMAYADKHGLPRER